MRSLRFLFLAAALILAVAAIYSQTYNHGFIAYDDDTYIYNVPEVGEGLTAPGLGWAFGFRAGNWHPLTWLSHMLDVELFGMRPGGHHLVNVGLHAANAVLLASVLTAATGAFWRSAAVAALFALHPLRVESVAWASERKDVLSSLFGLLALAAYVGYVRRPAAGRYVAVLACLILGLAAKPMLVTLPFVLLLLDWWPLGRHLPPATPAGATPRRPWLPLVLEKAPLFALALAASLAALRAQTTNVLPLVTPDLPTRADNALLSYVRYLQDFFWPAHLAFLYPYSSEGIPVASAVAAAAAIALVSGTVVRFGRRLPFLATGWFWYLGTLVPVIGLVQVGGQARSDRYTYLTTTGFVIMLVWLAGSYWPRPAAVRRALVATFLVALSALGMRAWIYTGYWRDSLTLFAYTVRATRDNYLVLNNYGGALLQAGRIDEAIDILQQSARVNPDHCNAHYNLGVALLKKAGHRDALASLLRSLQCYEEEGRTSFIADSHYNLGIALAGLGRHAEAESHFRLALRLKPEHCSANYNLGIVLLRRNAPQEAVAPLQRSLQCYEQERRAASSIADAHYSLGHALASMVRYSEAENHFRAALRIAPNYPGASSALGDVLVRQGKTARGLQSSSP